MFSIKAFYTKNRPYITIPFIFIVLIVLTYIAYSNGNKRAKFYNYWADGRKYPEEMTPCEIKAVKVGKEFAISMYKELNTEDSETLKISIEKAKDILQHKDHVDYKIISKIGKKNQKMVSKMFRDRAVYRIKLSKEDLKFLRSGIQKLSLSDKIDAGRYFIVM